MRFIFLDARDEVLIQRFSETRRRHPLADGLHHHGRGHRPRKRELLADLADVRPPHRHQRTCGQRAARLDQGIHPAGSAHA